MLIQVIIFSQKHFHIFFNFLIGGGGGGTFCDLIWFVYVEFIYLLLKDLVHVLASVHAVFGLAGAYLDEYSFLVSSNNYLDEYLLHVF